MARKSRFITPEERKQRIEFLMAQKGWSWYALAREMGMHCTSVNRAFKVESSFNRDVTMQIFKRLAIALDVSVGFLVDRQWEIGDFEEGEDND